ncbi:MAG: hypothetical protein ACREP9_22605 [Candidatus Dormibacteraceae bacterium]
MTARLEKHVRLNWPQCDKLVLRSRGPFVYVLAGTREDPQAEPWCRLRPLGSEDAWEFAYFTYSTEKYEPSFLPNGSPAGTPEECFDCAAAVLLVGAI